MRQSFFQTKISGSDFCRAAFFLLLTVAYVRGEILPIKNYTAADGLGSSVISALMRDSRGFLWFATRDGLSRFDGSRFVTYQVGDRNSPPGIEQVFETKKGIYWICTTRGIYRFDPNRLVSPQNNTAGARPILNAEFISEQRGVFYEDKDEKLWFYTYQTLNILEEKNGQVSINPVELKLQENSSTTLHINDFRQMADSSFWIVTSWGLARILPDGRSIFYSIDSSPADPLYTVFEDQANRVWLSRASGIYIFQPEQLNELTHPDSLTVHKLDELAIKQKDTRLPEKSGEIFNLTAIEGYGKSTGTFFYQSSDGRIWISGSNGVLEFDGQNFSSLTEKGNVAGVASSQMSAQMIEDSDGNLWFAGLKGLSRLDRYGFTSFNAIDKINNPNIVTIIGSAEGDIYAVNHDFQVSKFDGSAFQITRPPIPPQAKGLWTSNYAFLDSRGGWWFLTTDKAYHFADLSSQKPLAEYDMSKGLSGNQTYRIFEDRKGDIWISTRSTSGGSSGKSGLSRLNRASGEIHTFSSAENFPADKAASAFVEDENGNLWIGLHEGGLLRYSNGKFTAITEDLPSGLISSLHLDKKKRLWLTTALSGVSCIANLSDEVPKFIHYKIENGLASNNARSITEDDFGLIYVGTARGIDRITPETGQIKHYTTNDGLAGDFVQAAFHSRDGALWFGTPNGLSRLIPRQETKSSVPPVWFSDLRIAGESYPVSQLGAGEIMNLELAPVQNNLQIDFFGIDFKASQSLRYQYQLEGADTDWSTPSELRTVNYANLSAGNYRFLVRAISMDGTPSPNPAVISFTVMRPVWQRWWFLLAASVIAGFIIYSVYRYRVAQLLKLERIRTRIATDLHDDIGSSLSQIAILSEVVRQKVGENGAAAPLNLIAETSREMVDSMSDIVWAINPDKDHLSDLVQRMRRFASDVLEAQDIAYRFHLDEKHRDPTLGADTRREVYLIFKEAINNLVKYARATEVEMWVVIENNSLVVKVKDDGKGFDLSQAGIAVGGNKYDGFGGNGLINMRRRTENLGGQFTIDSRIDAGTVVVIEIPIR